MTIENNFLFDVLFDINSGGSRSRRKCYLETNNTTPLPYGRGGAVHVEITRNKAEREPINGNQATVIPVTRPLRVRERWDTGHGEVRRLQLRPKREPGHGHTCYKTVTCT